MIDLQGFGGLLAEGTWMTIRVTMIAATAGVCIGIGVALMKLSSSRLARLLAETYTTVLRGVPILLVILLFYFGAIAAVNSAARAFGYMEFIDVSAFAAGCLALSLAFGAYSAEVFRGAFQSIPRGQIEAARAIGLPSTKTFFKITLPQVWRLALPGLGNIFLVIMKETALISVVGLDELMRKTQFAVDFTKKPFTFFLVAALIYLGLTVITMGVAAWLEGRANRGFVAQRRGG
ncbi:polar amino acid transport system permease protein [Mycoplana sp. BE70]|uniref:ABC transporter permease n=1 Tax=Mycoplana sp. BE70 TaxID=2817775 RepID=UPI002859E3C2|nr:ABC transporter permease subunit [Mycoplana sp. BE70]MDR6759265.1 polar amino acid transport system permease protein [Mycoplana sp. BE70]